MLGVKRTAVSAVSADFDEAHTLDALDALLPRADIVIGCLPNTRETAGLLTAERLHAMKAGAVLVNVGRGSLAGTDDLVSALQDGHLGGAALDVFETEPLPADCPLWDMENVLLTRISQARASAAARTCRTRSGISAWTIWSGI